MQEKRYTVTVDLYVYATSDDDAKAKAKQFTDDVQFLINNTENRASVISIYETPFGKIGKLREVK